MTNMLAALKTADYGKIKEIHTAHMEYLRSIRSRLPESVAKYAFSEERFEPSTPDSMHDSALLHIELHPTFRLVLLGPFWDRTITLQYSEVSEFSVLRKEFFRGGTMLLGDFLLDDISIEDNVVSHSIRFSKGHIEIRATSFDCVSLPGDQQRFGFKDKY